MRSRKRLTLPPGVRGVPLAGEALGFAAIVRGHPACNYVATLDRELSLLTGRPRRREVVPHVRLHVVLRYAATFGVHVPEVGLRTGLPLVNR